MKKSIITLMAVLLILALLMPSIDSKIIDTEKNIIDYQIESTIIETKASSSYEYGLNVGRQFRLEFKLLDLLLRFSNKFVINEIDIEKQVSSLDKYCPDYLEELRGLSQGCKLRIERLLAIQSFLSKYMAGYCTVTLSTSPATKNNQTYLTQNWDIDLFPRGLPLLNRLFSYRLRIHNVKSHYRYVYLGIPILYEIFLINEKGLGWGAMATSLTENESRYIDEGDGIPIYLLERQTMRTCKNVSEVATLWINSERSSDKNQIFPRHWDYATTAWCDREGGILMIEQTHNHIITVFGNSTEITNASKGILWHCLHHQWLDPNLTGSKYLGEPSTSFIRAERAHEILESNYGNITLEVCKELCRDHGGGLDPDKSDPYDICWHPSRESKTVTSFSWIIQPKNFTVYMTHRIPCRSKYWSYDFSRIFNK